MPGKNRSKRDPKGERVRRSRSTRNDAKRDGRPHGPRPFWSGTITFGLVSVPVNLFPTTRSTGFALRLLAPDGAPLERRYVCRSEARDVDWNELVRGYEVDEDQYVELTDEELEALAPRKSRDIDLQLFTAAQDLDPLGFERAYVLTPTGDSTKPYRLLAEVMEREGKAGIATFVMRDKEHLVAILSRGGILWAETMRFAGELRTPEDVGLVAARKRPAPAKKDVQRFRRAMGALEHDAFDRQELADPDLERTRELVQRKQKRRSDVVVAPGPRKGKRSAHESEPDADGEEPDLFELIRKQLRGSPRAVPRGGGRAPRLRRVEALEELSKNELYERAQAAEVPGRSGMTKDELIEALRSSE
jgi:DNA end-binding protein Ku